jgi:hypothetical protein
MPVLVGKRKRSNPSSRNSPVERTTTQSAGSSEPLWGEKRSKYPTVSAKSAKFYTYVQRLHQQGIVITKEEARQKINLLKMENSCLAFKFFLEVSDLFGDSEFQELNLPLLQDAREYRREARMRRVIGEAIHLGEAINDEVSGDTSANSIRYLQHQSDGDASVSNCLVREKDIDTSGSRYEFPDNTSILYNSSLFQSVENAEGDATVDHFLEFHSDLNMHCETAAESASDTSEDYVSANKSTYC